MVFQRKKFKSRSEQTPPFSEPNQYSNPLYTNLKVSYTGLGEEIFGTDPLSSQLEGLVGTESLARGIYPQHYQMVSELKNSLTHPYQHNIDSLLADMGRGYPIVSDTWKGLRNILALCIGNLESAEAKESTLSKGDSDALRMILSRSHILFQKRLNDNLQFVGNQLKYIGRKTRKSPVLLLKIKKDVQEIVKGFDQKRNWLGGMLTNLERTSYITLFPRYNKNEN